MTEQPSDGPDQFSLSTEEITHLRDAFNFLYHGLKDAARRFEDPNAHDGGRDGAVHAVEYVLKFFTVLKETGIYPLIVDEGAHAPLARLLNDLMSLDDGKVSLMLRQKKKVGRARESAGYEATKGVAVFTVQCLLATGMSLSEARQAVAKVLSKEGVRPARKGSAGGSAQITERTLKDWQEDIAAAPAGEAAETLRLLNVEPEKGITDERGFASLGFRTADVRRGFLEKLAHLARAVRARQLST